MRENPSGGALIPSTGYHLTRTGFVLLAMRRTETRLLIEAAAARYPDLSITPVSVVKGNFTAAEQGSLRRRKSH